MIVILSLKELSTPAKSNIRKESLDCCSLMGLDGKAIETVLWFISTFSGLRNYLCLQNSQKKIKLRIVQHHVLISAHFSSEYLFGHFSSDLWIAASQY